MAKSAKITRVSDDPLDPDLCLPERSDGTIDIVSLSKLGKMGCINEEIADFFGITRASFQRRLHENPELSEALRRGRTQRKVSLRHKQTQIALDDKRGNQQVAMLIWIGKQDPNQGGLGQQESFKIKGDPDHPLEVSVSSASELLAAKIAQLVQRSGETEQMHLHGSIIDIEPSRANGASASERAIEAAAKPDRRAE